MSRPNEPCPKRHVALVKELHIRIAKLETCNRLCQMIDEVIHVVDERTQTTLENITRTILAEQGEIDDITLKRCETSVKTIITRSRPWAA